MFIKVQFPGITKIGDAAGSFFLFTAKKYYGESGAEWSGSLLSDPETGAAERMFVIFQSRQQIPGLRPELCHIRFVPHPSHYVMLRRLHNDALSEFEPLFVGSSALILVKVLIQLSVSIMLFTKLVTKF